jgi:hypothetical protein
MYREGGPINVSELLLGFNWNQWFSGRGRMSWHDGYGVVSFGIFKDKRRITQGEQPLPDWKPLRASG